jgi:deazaflavin-dependent oxidoreductase (nitroreductase family)
VLNRATDLHVLVYRLSRGRLLGGIGKAPFLLLHHVGRRSGKERVSPLIYVDDGARLALVASAGGAARHPAWYLNLRARPETEVEVRGERRAVHAREAEGRERERLWRRAAEIYPDYAVYARRTGRRIPVVVLEPRGR